jgi:hypothetical protein
MPDGLPGEDSDGGLPRRVPDHSATGLTLSMGPGQQGSTDTAHGDFINGWSQSALTALISGCAGPTRTCGHVTGADATVHPKKA